MIIHATPTQPPDLEGKAPSPERRSGLLGDQGFARLLLDQAPSQAGFFPSRQRGSPRSRKARPLQTLSSQASLTAGEGGRGLSEAPGVGKATAQG
jgi:hypothetical protein